MRNNCQGGKRTNNRERAGTWKKSYLGERAHLTDTTGRIGKPEGVTHRISRKRGNGTKEKNPKIHSEGYNEGIQSNKTENLGGKKNQPLVSFLQKGFLKA